MKLCDNTETRFLRLKDATYDLSRASRELRVEPLTVIVAVTSKDGILLYSDSQETERTEDGTTSRHYYQLKLHEILKERYALGCAGASDDINEFTGYLMSKFSKAQEEHLTPTELEIKLDREILPTFLEEVRKNRKRKFGKKVALDFDFDGLLAAKLGKNSYKVFRITIDINEKEKSHTPIAKARTVSQLFVCIGHDRQKADVFLGTVEHFLNKYNKNFSELTLELCGMICQLTVGLVFRKAIMSGGTIHALSLTNKGVNKMLQESYWDTQKNVIAQTILQCIKEVKPPKEKLVRFFSTLLPIDEELASRAVDWLLS